MLLCCQAYGQKHPFRLEYSPSLVVYHFSQTGWDEWRGVHSAFAKTEFYLSKRFNVTTGLGYFNIRSVRTVYIGDYTYGTHTHIFHNFISVPLGMKYKMKLFKIELDVATSYNFSNPTIHKTFSNGEITDQSRGDKIDYRHISDVIVPLNLTIGKEIPWKKNHILFGFKGSMSLHNISPDSYIGQTFYGLGLYTGMKWGDAKVPERNMEKQLKKQLREKKPIVNDTSFHLTIEYYPHRTATVTGNPNADTHEWSHNGFIKAEFPIDKHLRLTTGAGLLTTHDRGRRDGEIPNVVSITTLWSHHYVTIPAGIKYQLRRFSINPEIALAYNVDNSNKQYYSDTTGYVRLAERDQFPIVSDIKRIAIPALLTLGYELPLGKTKLIFGLKGHYGLTNFSNDPEIQKHFYGIGLMAGIKI